MIFPLGIVRKGACVRDDVKVAFEAYVSSSFEYLKHKSDFKVLSVVHFHEFKEGPMILKEFHGFHPFLAFLYPQVKWTIFDLDRVGNQFWKSRQSEKNYLEEISHNIPVPIFRFKDWQSFDDSLLKEFHGRTILNHNSSIPELLLRVFPEYLWEKISKFPSMENTEKKRVFTDGIVSDLLGFVERHAHLLDIPSRSLLGHPRANTILQYNSSLQVLFRRAYPELLYPWSAHLYDEIWKKRNFTDAFIMKEFGFVRTKEDLSELTVRDFVTYPEGITLLNINNSSIQSVLKTLYPEIIFERNERGYWKNFQNNNLIHCAVKYYDIKKKEDWYRISGPQIAELSGQFVPKSVLINLLEYWNPEEEWVTWKFSVLINRKSRQRHLGTILKRIYPKEVIHEEYLFKSSDGTVHLLDFFLPGLNLAIEYQGEQHYTTTLAWLSLDEQLKRDKKKIIQCQLRGLKLILVPFWWDNKEHSLRDLISKQHDPQ
eukprot:TRINITY_DN7978_c0_g2_i1.p1 TRINITY_DN7978_c0_g2~~TRINITY_DN7978_c0_g2_i1.p1  ORF type:complete len:485 (+),score=61.35 TRINITY_DN7978_c0_g2_i1:2-1456(+)